MDLAEEFRELASCCLHEPTWVPGDVAETVLTIEDSPECYAETDNLAIARLHDGWGVLTSWSDTTGHGCRCGAQTTRAATLHELLAHLTEDEILRILRKAAATDLAAAA